MRNLLLAVGFFGLFGVVVVTYPSYADNDLVVVAVVAGLLISGLVGILLSGKGPGSDDSEAP
ncbi:MAG: hypothetical protein K9G03_03960 [Pontimonas sp.]|nr:hypothetical protein [Pontimonas sp.]